MDSTEKIYLDKQLSTLPKRIEDKAEEKNKALEDYRRAEADIENEVAKIMTTEKAKVLQTFDADIERILGTNTKAVDKRLRLLRAKLPTIEDLKALAVQQTYDKRLEVIGKEATWRARAKEFDRLRDDFNALLEKSYNFRATLKAFRG